MYTYLFIVFVDGFHTKPKQKERGDKEKANNSKQKLILM